MSGSNPGPPPQAKAPPARNPVEQMIVRGFIVLLLVLVAVEAYPWYSHREALKTLQDKIAKVDQDAKATPVREADVKAAVGGKQPTETRELKGSVANGAHKLVVYDWFTLNPFSKRQLYVYYGHVGAHETDGAEVLEVEPDDQIAGPPKLSPEEQKAAMEAAAQSVSPPGMPGGAGGSGGPGGRPGGGGRGGRGGAPQHDPETGDAKVDTDKPADDKGADEKPKDADKDQ
jgi:hypothetical protein